MSDQASNNNVITIQSSDYSKIDSESIETADVYSTPPNELNYELMSDIHGSKHDSDPPMPNDRVTFQSDLHSTDQSNNVCAVQCHHARSELDSELKTNENDFEMSSTQPQVIEVVGEDEQIDLSNKFVNNVHCNTDNDEQKCFDQTIANNLPNRASTISQDGDDAKEKNAPKRKLTYHGAETDWPQVRLISSILFLGCIQMFVIGMSEWPYMQQVDKQATSTFFGYVGSVSALGHAICAPLMGYWSSATGQTKNPMIAGRIIALVGCALYVCLELFPRDRRYVMLTCYTIFGISMSSVSVMRGYVAKISTPNDRARAVSMFGLAVMLAVTVGPMFQMFFTTLSFPGIDMLAGKFWLNIYTGPIYVALVANIASLILIVFFFKEKHFDRHPPGDKKVSLQRKESQAKAALTTDMRSFNIPLALTCIFIRMAGTLTIVTINTTTSPMMMSVFGWSNTYTVRIGSVAQACVGILSLSIFVGFTTGKFNKILSQRKGALVSCLLFVFFFVITYPWSFAARPIPMRNVAANITGCNPTIYEWCADSLQVKPFVYLASMVVVLGIAITLATIAVDTLYSRILGNIDQGTMQGFFLFCMDIINVLGPLAIAPLFTSSGQKYIWPIDGSVAAAATIACLFAYAKFPR